jgi:hypothetical protein
MVQSYGHEYTVVVTYKMAVKVTAHEAEDAIDQAFEVIENALNNCEANSVEGQRAWADIARRGDEVLEPMEEDK